MKKYITKTAGRLTALLLFLLLTTNSNAQDTSLYEHKWYVPDHVILQYAGSIGFASGGVGYDLFKKKSHLDLLYGYVPRFTGSKAIHALTLKFNAMPIRIVTNNTTTIYPLNTGVYFCYTPGNAYSSRLPAWYPENYYWWSEAIRVNLFIGGSIKFHVRGMNNKSRVTAYYELATNEIKLVINVQNLRELSIWNIVQAGVGFRYHFPQ